MGKIWVEQGHDIEGASQGIGDMGRDRGPMVRERVVLHAEGASNGGSQYFEPADAFLERLARTNPLLSRTELQVCSMIRESLPSKEIAQKLNISKFTVDTHRKSIRRKMGLDEKESLYSILIRL